MNDERPSIDDFCNNKDLPSGARQIVAATIKKPPVKPLRYFLNRRSMCLYPVLHMCAAYSGPDFMAFSSTAGEALLSAWKNSESQLKRLKNRHVGSRIHVLGTGPSLPSTVSLIAPTDIVIGVNGAYEAHKLNYWVVLDDLTEKSRAAWRDYFINNTESSKVLSKAAWLDFDQKIPDVCLAENAGFDFTKDALSWNGSSMHAALHLALWMGAREVICHGLDYKDHTHFYKEENVVGGGWMDFARHVAGFEKLAAHAEKLNVQIWNANKQSNLRAFAFLEGAIPVSPASPELNVTITPEQSSFIASLREAELPPEPKLEVCFDLLHDQIGISNGVMTEVFSFEEIRYSENKATRNILNVVKALRSMAEKLGPSQT